MAQRKKWMKLSPNEKIRRKYANYNEDGPAVGYVFDRNKTCPTELRGFHLQTQIELAEREKDRSGKQVIYLLSSVEDNKVDIFESFELYLEHISAPGFKI